jgi:hypothetical protein
VQRHHWWPYVAWSVLIICLTAIVITAGIGYFEYRLRVAISQTPLTVGQRQVGDTSRTCLRRELSNLGDTKVSVGAIIGDRESMHYAADFIEMFAYAGVLNEGGHARGPQGSRLPHLLTSDDPTRHGVLVAVPDKTNPTERARLLHEILARCGIPPSYASMDGTENDLYLIIDQAP